MRELLKSWLERSFGAEHGSSGVRVLSLNFYSMIKILSKIINLLFICFFQWAVHVLGVLESYSVAITAKRATLVVPKCLDLDRSSGRLQNASGPQSLTWNTGNLTSTYLLGL